MALKGESKEKTLGLKGRPPKKFLSILQYSDGICNNANSQPECQKPAFLIIILIITIIKSLFIKR